MNHLKALGWFLVMIVVLLVGLLLAAVLQAGLLPRAWQSWEWY